MCSVSEPHGFDALKSHIPIRPVYRDLYTLGSQGDLNCCPSMIMSPFALDRNVPLIGLPRGGQIGADTDEQKGVGTSGGTGAGAQQTTAGLGCRSIVARELPASEAAVEAVSGGRSCGAEAPQCGRKLESRSRREVSTAGAAAVDADGRVVESRAKTAAASSPPGA